MPQATAPYTPQLEIAKNAIVIGDTDAAVFGNNVSVIIGQGVNLNRQVEIFQALDFLRQGLRENNLAGFDGFPLFTCVSIDETTFNNRRTSSTPANSAFDPNTDLAISIGDIATTFDFRVMAQAGIQNLMDALKEALKDNLAA